ncbi:MAG: UDP-3-O-(3-hydroxymyristoyl)glucosamine N-acyltransferase [Candidatus Omnitrophota bacterium]|jgi:UDP-3-O-[3-hydroxymyristoyl] glucosamine N-acyltransferase|nr:MAG: UDP-3-O-(3-hydroxymyristoyl)glucosamine N-acyltransferase [Candidatus Omnitrophota bacterium]
MKQSMATLNLASSLTETSDHESMCVIHPSSVVDASVRLGEGVHIGPNVVIERGVRIGDKTRIYANCYIGEDCAVGSDSVLHHSVTLREKTQVGSRVVIEAGVVIGSDGFGYAKENNGVNCKVPQVGFVIIEDEVRIGANSTIDRATLGKTIVGKGTQIGSLVQVGHNVVIGEQSTISDGVGICGSCKIGSEVLIGYGVGMVGHIRIGDKANVRSGSGVSKDVADGSTITGAPAMEEEQYQFHHSFINKLPEFVARLNALEESIQNQE